MIIQAQLQLGLRSKLAHVRQEQESKCGRDEQELYQGLALIIITLSMTL